MFETTMTNDSRSLPILAKSIYRELRAGGLSENDVLSIAGEILSLVTADVRTQPVQEPPST